MQNFPKHVNSKADVLNLIEMFPEKTKAYLQNSIDGYKNFVPVAEYDNEEDCIKDETHDYVVTESDGITKYIQREYLVVQGNDLDRLGIPLEEANKLLLNK